MSGDSSSQDPSFILRPPADQSEKSPPLHSEADYLSTLLESGHAPGYQQGAFPTPATVSPFNSPRSNLEGDFQPEQSFRIPLRQQNSAASLDPNTSIAGSSLDPDAPLPGRSAQPSSDNLNREERLRETEPR